MNSYPPPTPFEDFKSNQGQYIMHYRYFMSTGVSWKYKIVEFREILFIGYLVMNQFVDFSATEGQ